MAVFTVDTLNDSGQGSLRAALIAANADTSGTPTRIQFDVAGTITLSSDLPAITRTMAIDATTAPTHTTNGPPVVGLDCNGHAGLVFAPGSDASSLLGLALGGASGNGVTLEAGSITLDGNYVGLTVAGEAFGNLGDGIWISASSGNNLIGVNPSVSLDGTTAVGGYVANVISGNAGNGISLHGSANNSIVDNRIGTDPTGTIAIGNGGNGIWVTALSHDNEIGGTAYIDSTSGAVNDPTGDKGQVTPVFVVPPLGNLISGNGANGVLIDAGAHGNGLSGNFIGTSAAGDTAIGNTLDGVKIDGADDNALTGCLVTNNPFVYYNVISGNGGNGLHVTGSNGTVVQGNFLGVGADNASIVANQLNGILVDGTSTNTTVGGVIPLGNVSAGNGLNGIAVVDTASDFITFNTFGGLYAFGGAAPNGQDGLLITSTGGNNTVRTNVFSGNLGNGIELAGDASGVTIDPNIVGLDTVGNAALPNGQNGLEIGGTAHGNVIGGTTVSVIPQNTFSGNAGYGVVIEGSAYANQLFLSSIGLSARGTTGSVPGQPGTPGGNTISGNTGNGITLAAGSSASTVTNNAIGYDRFGLPRFPNTGEAIVNDSGPGNLVADNTIACFTTGTRFVTARGEVAVEALRIGDRLWGELHQRWHEIIWIGRRAIDCRRHPAPDEVQPVRIAAGAFGPGQPARGLLLSPDHAVYANRALIPAKHLVDRRGITPLQVDRVEYWHVELARHDVVTVQGLPVETYLDTGDRGNFANGGGAVRLFPDFGGARSDIRAIWEANGCARLVVQGVEVERVRKHLALVALQPRPDASRPETSRLEAPPPARAPRRGRTKLAMRA